MQASALDWWKLWKEHDALYECPKGPDGRRLGPLVGYAGTDPEGKNYVGDLYANMAVFERYPAYLKRAARDLCSANPTIAHADLICGAPMGGLAFGLMIANVLERGYFYPDQEVIEGTRKKRLVFDRHEGVAKGKEVVIVEDVCNNFSTTDTLIALIEAEGGKVAGIACLLNRSLDHEETFRDLPIHALVRRPTAQYRQSDPDIQEDLAKHGFVLKPKHEWPRLKEAMRTA